MVVADTVVVVVADTVVVVVVVVVVDSVCHRIDLLLCMKTRVVRIREYYKM